MYLDRIEVENVRNISRAHLDLGRNLNVIEGPNGAGKTAILEALHLLVRARSFRPNTQALVRYDQDQLVVRATMSDEAGKRTRIGFQKVKNGNSEIRMDGSVVKQLSTVAAMLPLQVFLPNLSDLVFGTPSVRRKWLDWGVFHVKRDYLDIHRAYMKVLRQRNAALKQKTSDPLHAWTNSLVEYAEILNGYRAIYLDRVSEAIVPCLGSLAPGLNVRLTLDPGWQNESFASELERQERRDIQLGATQKGPHRADIKLNVLMERKVVQNRQKRTLVDEEHGARNVSSVLSRGQGKALASAIYIGQALDLSVETGKKSLFLIDDAGSELDKEYNRAFFDLLSEIDVQVIATTAAQGLLDGVTNRVEAKVFHVKHGIFCQPS